MKSVLRGTLGTLLALGLLLPLGAPALAVCLGTALSLSASAVEVSPGDTVELTIVEDNTGSASLTDVSVELDDGTTVVILTDLSPEFAVPGAGGDTDGDHELDPTETWTWIVTVNVDAEITYTATGHGFYGATDITFPCYPERDSVTVSVTNGGGEGLTPGYWKNHLVDWAATAYDPNDLFDDIFGVDAPGDMTLDDAVNVKGNSINSIIRHGVAALLNASHPDVAYDLSEAYIIGLVQDAFDGATKSELRAIKLELESYNELGGSIP